MRIGVFGGSFDPIHSGHLFVAEAMREACALERILFVPTRDGKHYRDGAMNASAADRATMVRLAVAGNVAFAVDESDLDPGATGYTADLLPRLQARYPGGALTFIVGADSLVRSQWRRLDDVLDAVERFVIAPRGDVAAAEIDAVLAAIDPERRSKIGVLDDFPLASESATLIRKRLQAGKSVRYLVPEPVYRYIEEHGLYRA